MYTETPTSGTNTKTQGQGQEELVRADRMGGGGAVWRVSPGLGGLTDQMPHREAAAPLSPGFCPETTLALD